MSRIIKRPVALTIAGSNSGGGAGIQADLKTFAALGVHGASAITCVTAQNPRRVTGIQPVRLEIVRRQIEAVFDELPPAAVKTGMLFSAGIIRVVADFFRRGRRPPLVVDPVMISTSGAKLLQPSAIKVLEDRLLPLAALVMPNLHEAEILAGRRLNSMEDLREAAREIHRRFGCPTLVKGGHLRGTPDATDAFFDGRRDLLLTAPRVRGVITHGTGCVYSAAIAGCLAAGHSLPRAIELAKRYITRAIARSCVAGRHPVLDFEGR